MLASAAAAANTMAAPRSAEELLYKHALSLAKEGAVKELVGQFQGAMEYYGQVRARTHVCVHVYSLETH